MEEQLKKKLEDLDVGQREILRRIEDEARMLRNVIAEIGGVPDVDYREKDRRTLRWRIHALENDREAVRIAGDAVEAATRARDAAEENTFTRREKLVGLLIAAVVAAGPYIAPYFHH